MRNPAAALAPVLAPLRTWLGLGKIALDRGDVLCISVSELEWRTTVLGRDMSAPTIAQARMPLDSKVATVDVLRRAVRSIAPAQRERIGEVRVLFDDPATCLVDNRSIRIKSDDPVAIRQAGAQELGAPGATYASQPFGESSEHELPRGIYAFLSTSHIQDYFGALDSLAIKLVELVPSGLVRLAKAADAPFALLDVRVAASTLLLADPRTGLVCSREIPVGVHNFAAAIAEATSVSVTEAASGLERRSCFATNAGAEGAPPPVTATERALAPILALLREQIGASLEYFVFQRLARPPEQLELTGEIERVRGLGAWLGAVMELPPQPAADLHAQMLEQPRPGFGNLLSTIPKGLLKVGKSEYRFVDGRFVPEGGHKPTPSRPAAQAAVSPGLKNMTRRLGDFAVPACIAAIGLLGAAAVAFTVTVQAETVNAANGTLSSALVEDGIIRSGLAKWVQEAPHAPPLYWTEKLSAIAAAMPASLRLVKLSSSEEGTAGNRGAKLLLEGEAEAGTDYLRQISDLISQLSGDRRFMRDTAAISFDGATADRGGATNSLGSVMMRFGVTITLKPKEGQGS